MKDVFLEYRVPKKVRTGLKEALEEAWVERDHDLSDPNMTPTQKKQRQRFWQEHIEEKRKEHLESSLYFAIPKLYNFSHFVSLIILFGALVQWSIEVTEAAHQDFLKLAWTRTNKSGNVELQMLKYTSRQEPFSVRRLNNTALINPHANNFGEQSNRLPSEVFSVQDQKITSIGSKIQNVGDLIQYVGVSEFPDVLTAYLDDNCATISEIAKISVNLALCSLYHGIKVSVADFQTRQ